MYRIVLLTVLSAILLTACKQGEKAIDNPYNGYLVDTLTAINVSPAPEMGRYNASRTREHDLLHTRLDVRFDWENQYCNGTADLTLHPYFYETDRLVLDAKGFDLKKVQLVLSDTSKTDLKFDYDNRQIDIELPRMMQRTDTFTVHIEYTAKPNELEAGGSAAITSDIGLYFINPTGEEDKPQQIWTQGETEASSCWFPTIDSPNERMSQELYITVQKRFKTLSNGRLEYSLENPDGTRTDYWKQDLPHAPYLTMMAIGEFAVVPDKWRELEVNYYVEPEYEQYAKDIFGKTPAMIEFFSQKLGVDYPWDKYHQVIVRDYVSGAMENTSAVIFGEFVQQTSREMLDQEYEDVVSHELFHHWFGDLVTCESWANLPLNESFATYGEYLWREHSDGRDWADMHQREDLNAYLEESRIKQEDLVRFDYNDKEDMFDSHSYAKGGLVLHMLRKYVGDAAFWESLNLYLTRNRYTAVEMHDLRLAFEDVTGEDLNWFFNQWFFASGHPQLLIDTEYNDSLKTVALLVEQQQDFESTPLYRLPVAVDVYANGQVHRHELEIAKESQVFLFDVSTRPDLVVFDAENMLLGQIREIKSVEEWAFQYRNAPLYYDRYLAVQNCAEMANREPLAAQVVYEALSDPFWDIRLLAVKSVEQALSTKREGIYARLKEIVASDSKAAVRAFAVSQLAYNFENAELESVYGKALKDSSYFVLSEGLMALATINEEKALEAGKRLENEPHEQVTLAIADLYAEHGTDKHNGFFQKHSEQGFSGYNEISFIMAYETYLLNGRPNKMVEEGVDYFGSKANSKTHFYTRLMSINALRNIDEMLGVKKHLMEKEIASLHKEAGSASDMVILQGEITRIDGIQRKIESHIQKALE